MFSSKSIEHLEVIDGFNKKHGGIKGAHTLDSFNKFSEDVRPVQIVSKEKIVSMAKEAFNSRDVYITLGNQIYINGISKNGVKFEGWINSITKELDSFYPVKQWQFEY